MNRTWIAGVAAGVLATSACGPRTPEPQPVPPPAPAHGTLVISPPPPLQGVVEDITACVVRNGRMEMTPAHFYPVTGDTTVNGRPFRDVFPVTAEHASSAAWYVDNEPVPFDRVRFVKYGLPRALAPADLVPVGTYRGVALFTLAGSDPAHPEVIYVPVNSWCEFQPYQGHRFSGEVRG